MGTILVGSLPGVWIGTALLPRIPVDGLRPVLGAVLLGAALGVLNKAGVPVHPAFIIGGPAAVGLAAWVLHKQRTAQLPVPEPEVAVAR
jgi:hypothetical protein